MPRSQKYIIHEQIIAEWVDMKTALHHTLGSCSLRNRHATDFFMRVGIEPETGHPHIYISLVIDTFVSTKKRSKEMRLILPPHAFEKTDNSLAFESLHILDPSSSSIIQQADLTNSGHIIRVNFNLASEGCVVIPKSKNPIKPATSTSHDLFQCFKSLSAALSFNIYMRQSDYAESGLKILNQKLRNTTIGPYHINLVGMLEGRDAMFMEWVNSTSDDPRQKTHETQPPPSYVEGSLTQSPTIRGQPLPSYTMGSSTSSAKVQIPQSPPNTRREETLQYTTETVLVETPLRIPSHDSPIPPTQTPDRYMVDIRAEIENEIGSDDEYYAALQARDLSLDREAASFVIVRDSPEIVAGGLEHEIDPDKEHYDIIYAREASLVREVASISQTLLSEVAAWFAGAMTINNDVYEHQRLTSKLFALGHYARTRNPIALNATMIWCSTILFYDPVGSGKPELWNARSQWLISDMAKLIRWANTFCRSPEMCLPCVRSEFVKLGNAARAVALKLDNNLADHNLAEHRRQRAQCLAVFVSEVGRLGMRRREP